MKNRVFKIRTHEQDAGIVRHDDADFTRTKKYIEELILEALLVFDAPDDEKSMALQNLTHLIPVAAKRYLGNPKNFEHKFSTYFTWYIHEEFKKYNWNRKQDPKK
ncbi:MAG: hypothetical protein KBC02_01165 [Candidatus Pacebacteria bacterium]|nr:hypothetical protein [Candidatus Paceibacterota bacterium]